MGKKVTKNVFQGLKDKQEFALKGYDPKWN